MCDRSAPLKTFVVLQTNNLSTLGEKQQKSEPQKRHITVTKK
jgi:hypothetical protein